MLGFGPFATFLIIVVVVIISGIKILKEYQRAVIFRLGRMVDPRGPGITYVIPVIESIGRAVGGRKRGILVLADNVVEAIKKAGKKKKWGLRPLR